MENLNAHQLAVINQNFRGERYEYLNNLRWEKFLKMGIPIQGKVIFEPGAGIGDQTEWLLSQGAKHIYVSEGRPGNLEIIQKRFGDDTRLTYLLGDLEVCLTKPEYKFSVDLVFLWGVYYHINDSLSDFRIMRELTNFAPLIVFEYLESPTDGTDFYGYDSVSTSISQYGIRPTTETMMSAIQKLWGHAYLPKDQIDWIDPFSPGTPRRLMVGSKTPLDNSNLTQNISPV